MPILTDPKKNIIAKMQNGWKLVTDQMPIGHAKVIYDAKLVHKDPTSRVKPVPVRPATIESMARLGFIKKVEQEMKSPKLQPVQFELTKKGLNTTVRELSY